jgi:hypothetical protein
MFTVHYLSYKWEMYLAHQNANSMTKYLSLAIGLLLLATACSKDDDPEPAPTTAPITGTVALYDEATTAVEKNGMTVTVEGSTLKATTAADGKFTINDVPFGNKTLVFEKAGYGTHRVFNVDHKSNNGLGTVLTNTVSLGRSSSTSITALSGAAAAGDYLINPTTSPAASNGAPKYVRLFFHNASTVSNTVYTRFSEAYTIRINPGNITLTKTFLNGLGFASGSTIYVRAYGESFFSNAYTDPTLTRDVFPNLNNSSAAAIAIVVP